MNFLVTAIGSMSAAAVIASLRSLSGAYVVGCNSLPFSWTAQAIHVDSFHEVPPACDEVSYISALALLCKSLAIDWVIPLTDVEIDILDKNRSVFSACGAQLCMPSSNALRISRDKWMLYRHFSGQGLAVTIPCVLMGKGESMLSFPLVAKPRRGRSSKGVVRLDDELDLAQLLRRIGANDYIVQPFIDGHVIVVDVVRQQASGFSVAIGRRELQRTLNGAGLVVEMGAAPELIETAKYVADSLGVNGCVNIEFIVDREGHAFLMDINPRFSAGVAFSKMIGYDMVANHIRCFSGESIDGEIVVRKVIYCREYIEVDTGLVGDSYVTQRA